MAGKLYGIGVGPGDPELLTLKAKKILDAADIIAIPVKEIGEDSTAFDIIKPVVKTEGKEILEVVFSMHPEEAEREKERAQAGKLLAFELAKGKDIAMITLGDVAVYSTYMYVNQYVAERGFETAIVPGIPSFCSGAARAGIPLMEGNEGLAIVPSARENELLSVAMDRFQNIVVMKAGNSMEKLTAMMAERNIPAKKATVLSRIGFADEYVGPLDTAREYSYFTTVIIKK